MSDDLRGQREGARGNDPGGVVCVCVYNIIIIQETRGNKEYLETSWAVTTPGARHEYRRGSWMRIIIILRGTYYLQNIIIAANTICVPQCLYIGNERQRV